MTLRCLDQVFSRHREPWFGAECHGADLASAGGQVVGHGICRVNRHFHIDINMNPMPS